MQAISLTHISHINEGQMAYLPRSNEVCEAVADLGGRPWRAPPLRPEIFSMSCSFSQNLAKSYVGNPWRVGTPS